MSTQVGRAQLEGRSASLLSWHYVWELAGLVEALVDSAADREESVRNSIFKSVVDIGRKKHSQVLEVINSYLSKHSKVCVPCM